MKRIIMILIMCVALGWAQTTTFTLPLRSKTTGQLVPGKDVDLYQSGIKKYDLTETSPGVYSNSAVATGKYDVYVNGSPLTGWQGVWHGSDKLTSIEGHANSLGQLSGSGIQDSVISLNKFTTAAYNYIGSGGSITNNPDDVSLKNVSGSKLGIKDSYFMVVDTNSLKALNVEAGATRFLQGLTSGSNVGAGRWVLTDSTTDEDGITALSSLISGKQWVREKYINDKRVNITWAGALPGVSGSVATRVAIQKIAQKYDNLLIPEGDFYTDQSLIFSRKISNIKFDRGAKLKTTANIAILRFQSDSVSISGNGELIGDWVRTSTTSGTTTKNVGQYGIWVKLGNSTNSNVPKSILIEGITFKNLGEHSVRFDTDLTTTQNVGSITVRDCYFYENYGGIHVSEESADSNLEVKKYSIINNYFDKTGTVDYATYAGSDYQESWYSGNTHQNHIYIEGNIKSVIIKDNYFGECGRMAVELFPTKTKSEYIDQIVVKNNFSEKVLGRDYSLNGDVVFFKNNRLNGVRNSSLEIQAYYINVSDNYLVNTTFYQSYIPSQRNHKVLNILNNRWISTGQYRKNPLDFLTLRYGNNFKIENNDFVYADSVTLLNEGFEFRTMHDGIIKNNKFVFESDVTLKSGTGIIRMQKCDNIEFVKNEIRFLKKPSVSLDGYIISVLGLSNSEFSKNEISNYSDSSFFTTRNVGILMYTLSSERRFLRTFSTTTNSWSDVELTGSDGLVKQQPAASDSVEGRILLVATNPLGDFSGQAEKLATFTSGAWVFESLEGIYNRPEVFDGTNFIDHPTKKNYLPIYGVSNGSKALEVTGQFINNSLQENNFTANRTITQSSNSSLFYGIYGNGNGQISWHNYVVWDVFNWERKFIGDDRGINNNSFTQFSRRRYNKTPVGNLIPIFIGEEVFVPDSSAFYKSYGTTNTQWIKIK